MMMSDRCVVKRPYRKSIASGRCSAAGLCPLLASRHVTRPHRKRLKTMTLLIPPGSNILCVEKLQVCPDDADIKGEGRDRMPNILS